MASKGRTYEAIVWIALEELKRQRKLEGEIFWNETPEGMAIEPDFTVGPDKDHPELLFLITHSGAAGNSHLKFWRNIGELAEAKVRLPGAPRVYSVAFEALIKEDLKKLQDATFDGQLIVGDEGYGHRLQWWVDANHEALPREVEALTAAIRSAMVDARRTEGPRGLFDELVKKLAGLLRQHRFELDALWGLERERPVGEAPRVRHTFVRRGLAKLLILPREYLEAAIGGHCGFPRDERLVPAELLGVVRPRLGGLRLADPEALSALALLPQGTLARILLEKPSRGLRAVIGQVQAIVLLDRMLAGVTRAYAVLTTPEGMLRALERQYREPRHLLEAECGHAPEDVWLFRVVCDVVKAAGRTRQTYGYAQLIKDVKALASDKTMEGFVRQVSGNPRWRPSRSTEPVRRGLQDFVNRIEGASFSRELLAVTAFALARRLALVPRAVLSDIQDEFFETWASTAFEARLLPHRAFEPLGTIIKKACEGGRAREVYLRACFAEAAGEMSSKLSGTTKVLLVEHSIVGWRSSHGSHTNDKRKELCGRAVALRYSWRAGRFAPRPGIRKLMLVVDGTWKQEDLNALVRAGWDEIFYPDEVDKLVKAIV